MFTIIEEAWAITTHAQGNQFKSTFGLGKTSIQNKFFQALALYSAIHAEHFFVVKKTQKPTSNVLQAAKSQKYE